MTTAIKILLVDDHPVFCQGFRASAQNLRPDMVVCSAAGAEEALAIVAADPDLACVLVDIGLPGTDGFETVRLIGRVSPFVPRIIISGREDAAARLRARHSGASGFISKSSAPAVIFDCLDRVLAGEAVFEAVDSAKAEWSADDLTPRQLEVLSLMAQGLSNKEIEFRLDLADRTVRAHITEVFKVMGVQTRTRALIEARQRGLIA